ncbi:MAG: TonB family protein [Sphingomonadales bacterium]|nr:TonB family protein [Sphingomonadales bacterium]MDE2568827.1 TonB family protein [Sphingomonadales bacterium]
MTEIESTTGTRYVDAPRLSRRAKAAIVAVILLIHAGLVLAIIHGLGGVSATLEETGLERVVTAFNIPLPPPPPPPPAPEATTREAEGKAAAAAPTARAKAVSAPLTRIPRPRDTAAPVSSTGDEARSGAAQAGQGTGGGGEGDGTGSGGSGNGAGGRFVATKAVKIAGDITSARDYPAAGRDDRIGKSVVVALTVGTDGSVRACRVHRPSGDDEADRITCELAMQRFRFRPALDQNGQPIQSVYGWEQRWFRP